MAPTDKATAPSTAKLGPVPGIPPITGCVQMASIGARQTSTAGDLCAASTRMPVATPATASHAVQAAVKTNIATRQMLAAMPARSRTSQATAEPQAEKERLARNGRRATYVRQGSRAHEAVDEILRPPPEAGVRLQSAACRRDCIPCAHAYFPPFGQRQTPWASVKIRIGVSPIAGAQKCRQAGE